MKNEGKTEVRTEGKVKNEVKVKDEEKIEMTLKKENEETIQEIAKEVDNLDKPETDIVTRDVLIDRINSYLGEEPLNVKDGDFCYIRVVRNHLEIGRAKIILEE